MSSRTKPGLGSSLLVRGSGPVWHTAEGEGYAAGRHVALEDRDELGIVGYDHESAAQVIGEEGARLVWGRVRVRVGAGGPACLGDVVIEEEVLAAVRVRNRALLSGCRA